MQLRLRFITFTLTVGFLLASGFVLAGENRLMLAGQVMLQHNLAVFDSPEIAHHQTLQKIKRDTEQVFDAMKRNDVLVLELESALKVDADKGASASLGREKDSDFFHEIERSALVDLLQNKSRLARHPVLFAGANNHVSDNGAAGIERLIALFEELKVPLAGIGLKDQAAAPHFLTIQHQGQDAQKFALVAFATDKVKLEAKKDALGVTVLSMMSGEKKGIKSEDEQRILHSIASARDQQSSVVAYHHNHHWSQEKVNQAGGVEQWRIDFARRCIDRGADVYFAHGEPRLQGIEIYQGKPIFYGLGNFVFQTRKVNFYQSEVWESVLVELVYADPQPNDKNPLREITSIKLIPLILNEHGADDVYFETRGLPALAKGAQAKNILVRLQMMSQAYGTQIEIDDSNPQASVGMIHIRR